MKSYIKYILPICLCIGLLSCKKGFLEESSQDMVRPTTVDALNQIMTGEAYSTNTSFLMHPYIEMLTDDIQTNYNSSALVISTISKYSSLFGWQKDMFERMPENSIEANPWLNYYKRIKGCNVVLDNLNLVSGPDAEKQNLRGQALALRSFYYLMLVNYFGKPYSEATAEQDLGVPLILSAEVTDAELPRATVKAVYQQIENDLTQAVELLKTTDAGNHIYKFNANSARFLLARIALYKRNWDASIDLSTQVLQKNAALKQLNEIPTLTTLFPISSGITSPEVIWGYSIYGEVSLFPLGALYPNKGAFSLSDNLISTYDPNDLRPSFYYASGLYESPALTSYKTGSRKYGATGNGKAFRTAEVYLNRAEAYIQKALAGDQSAVANALADLNTLRFNRIKTGNYQPLTITDPQTLFQFYKEERRRELALEDHRWFDLRRWGMPALSHTLYQNDGTATVVSLSQNDSRYVLQIPQVVLSRNSQLIQNP